MDSAPFICPSISTWRKSSFLETPTAKNVRGFDCIFELETKKADPAEKQIQDMILRLSSTMDVKAMATLLNMSVDVIKKYL